jgi:hypothetical protein
MSTKSEPSTPEHDSQGGRIVPADASPLGAVQEPERPDSQGLTPDHQMLWMETESIRSSRPRQRDLFTLNTEGVWEG